MIKRSETKDKELKGVISKVSHTSQAFQSAYNLLNFYKGGNSDDTGIKSSEFFKVLNVVGRIIEQV